LRRAEHRSRGILEDTLLVFRDFVVLELHSDWLFTRSSPPAMNPLTPESHVRNVQDPQRKFW